WHHQPGEFGYLTDAGRVRCPASRAAPGTPDGTSSGARAEASGVRHRSRPGSAERGSDDLIFDLWCRLMGAGPRTTRAQLQGWVSALAVAGEQLTDPKSGSPVAAGELSDAPPLEYRRLHQITRQAHLATSQLVASTMSCDTCHL